MGRRAALPKMGKRDLKRVRAAVEARAYRCVANGRTRVNAYVRRNQPDDIPRSDLTVDEWIAICESLHYRCAYCRRNLAETWSGNTLQMEHIEPIERGGDHSKENVVPSCAGCNVSKRQLLLLEWMCIEVKAWRSSKGGRRNTVRLDTDQAAGSTSWFDMLCRRAA